MHPTNEFVSTLKDLSTRIQTYLRAQDTKNGPITYLMGITEVTTQDVTVYTRRYDVSRRLDYYLSGTITFDQLYR